ncbi:MAG TPA: transketolase C-terminal domain-containing protein, partial [Clostridium sp.]
SKKEIPDVLLMASGSEVELIFKAADELATKGIDARVISMPSFELFEAQDEAYKESVMPNKVRARVAVEALTSFGWHKYVGLDGEVISLDTFGASGNANTLFKQFGFTVENVVDTAATVVSK